MANNTRAKNFCRRGHASKRGILGFLGGNLDLNFPFDTVSGFGGAHVSSSVICTRLCPMVESQSRS